MQFLQRTIIIAVLPVIPVSAFLLAAPLLAQGSPPTEPATEIAPLHFQGLQWRPLGPEGAVLRLAADTAFPYRVYATREDGATLRAAHRTAGLGISPGQWMETAGAEGGGVAPSPLDPETVYGTGPGGWIERWQHQTGERRRVTPRPRAGANRSAHPMPLQFSPHDGEVLYTAGQRLFMTDDGGDRWRAISPPLVATAEGVVTTAAESAARPGTFWAGSSDGRVVRSTDYGAIWRQVTPPGLPQPATIVVVEPAPRNQDGAYVLATAAGRSHLFRTEDHGATWRSVTLPGDGPVAAFRADPRRDGLLYVGDESGVHVSFDQGRRWLPLGLPEPVTDLLLQEDDLLAATPHGVWMLDNTGLLAALSREVIQRPLHLFAPAPAHRLDQAAGPLPQGWGANPPAGIALDFLLGPGADPGAVRLELLQEDGTLLHTLRESGESAPGHHRVWWDLRHPGAPPEMPLGPRVAPGNYLVRLTVGEASAVAQLAVLPDPRLPFPVTATRLQVEALLTIRRLLGQESAETEDPAVAAWRQDLATLAADIAVGQNRPTSQALAVLQELREAMEALEYPADEKTTQ
jgi:hypothetical protein